jgi:hypothetical protein
MGHEIKERNGKGKRRNAKINNDIAANKGMRKVIREKR